ncbi:DUF58 domain-containing protein [Nocardioides sp. NPDC057577]|uniref:DUF58 domain-containing protein n=1 Tax=Nocardioides sp. NPDC057577 TaxID=3346171 RepID=UPI00366B6FA2
MNQARRTPESAFRRLDLTVQRRVSGLLQGETAGLRIGPGSDAEELVPYSPGHDVRRIDWNATARLGDPHVWLTQAEHELETWVLVDRTPSMAFGTALAEKVEVAEATVSAIGIVADGPGNRVGLGILDADGVRWRPPTTGRRVARRLLTTEPPSPRTAEAAGAGFATALVELARRARIPGLRVIVSDLLPTDGTWKRPFDWEPALRRLTARHDVIVVEIVDPREVDLPAVGHVTILDPESNRQHEADTSDPRLRAAYAEAMRSLREHNAEAVRVAGADHLRVSTDDDWARLLIRMLRRRARHPRPARSRSATH